MNNLSTYTENALSNKTYAGEFTKSLAETTKRTYSSDIKQFFKVDKFEDISIEMIQSVTTDMANDWVRKMLDKGYKKETINKKLAALSGFYEYLCRRNVAIVEYNPFDKKEGCVRMKNSISSYVSSTALTDEEVDLILNTIPKTAQKDHDLLVFKRDYIIITFLLITGCRRDELTNIRIGDIRIEEDKPVVRIVGKGGKERVVVIPNRLYEKILDYVQLRRITMKDVDEYMVTSHFWAHGYRQKGLKLSNSSVNAIVKKYAEKAGLDPSKVKPHAFRHTFCTESLRSGAKIEDVQDLMGHASVKTTRRYDHINRTIENSTSDFLAEKYNI
jgi:integrase/recombinase XerC